MTFIDLNFIHRSDKRLSHRRIAIRTRRLSSACFLFCVVVSFAFSAAAQIGCTASHNCDVTDNGGPIMQSPVVYLIFWLPSGFNFDPSGSAGNTTYENLLKRFFTDLAGSNYYNILSEYPGTCTPPAIATQTPCFGNATLGGSTVVTTAYPSAGTTASPLSDANIQAQISSVITAQGWGTGLNHEYFVFLGSGVQECFSSTSCTFGGTGISQVFCAYHSNFVNAAGATVLYGVMPDANSLGSGCDFNISKSPNNLISADREIGIVSHEFFESVSDPLIGGAASSTAWNGPANEIGDICNQTPGNVQSNGSNVTLNGNPYVVQEQWSNNSDACILGSVNNQAVGATIQNTFVTGIDDLRDNSTAGGQAKAQSGTYQGTFAHNGPPGWDNGSTHVLVNQYHLALNDPLMQEVVTLTSHSSFPQGGDSWKIESMSVKVRNPDGTFVCQQSATANPLATVSDNAPFTFVTTSCVPPPPQSESVECFVFDDGYTNIEGPSDAIFISGRSTNNEKGKACIPGGTFGHCHKWFGRCRTVTTHQAVNFQVFNDGSANLAGPSDAVYIPTAGNQACIPDQTSTGTCRRWFGLASTGTRPVSCTLFDDGYVNQTNLTDAIYIPHPIPNGGQACMPDNTATGICRRWFGRCIAH